MSTKINVTLIKSHIGTPEKHRKILCGLGLTRRLKTVALPDTVEVRGMIQKVSHMVRIEQ